MNLTMLVCAIKASTSGMEDQLNLQAADTLTESKKMINVLMIAHDRSSTLMVDVVDDRSLRNVSICEHTTARLSEGGIKFKHELGH